MCCRKNKSYFNNLTKKAFDKINIKYATGIVLSLHSIIRLFLMRNMSRDLFWDLLEFSEFKPNEKIIKWTFACFVDSVLALFPLELFKYQELFSILTHILINFKNVFSSIWSTLINIIIAIMHKISSYN